MGKRVQIALAVLVVAIAGVIAWQVMHREPVYEGKHLSKWLADLAMEASPSQDEPACAVRAIGTNSLPWMMAMVRSTDPAWKRAVLAFNAKQRFIRIAVRPANVARFDAVQGYRVLGSAAKGSVPELIHLLETEPSPQVRSSIAQALGAIGPAARAAIPALRKAAQDNDKELRLNAAFALVNIEGWSEPRSGPTAPTKR
jgi:hypothetical protein